MTYVKPEALTVTVMHFESLLLSESQTPRQVGGDPTNNGLPTTTGETDGQTNPYGDENGNNGQGNDGFGNRSKGGLWDDWDDEE